MPTNEPGSKDQQPTPGTEDNTGQALESGEPMITGRSHGEIINSQGAGAGKEVLGNQNETHRGHSDNTSGKSGKTSQAPESGRQRATP